MTDDLKLLLDTLYPDELLDGVTILVRGLHIDKSKPIWSRYFASVTRLLAARGDLERWAADNRSVFFGVALREGRRGDRDHCWGLSALWADLDASQFFAHDGDPDRIAVGLSLIDQTLAGFTPAPSIIINSGGGKQAYWLLQEPCPCRKAVKTDALWGAYVTQVESILTGMQSVLHSDPARLDFGSLMRLPGFANPKYPHRPVARIEFLDATRRYAL